jgi:hypothetical protein
MLRLTPSIHLSLGLPLLRVPSGSHSKIFSGCLFPGILFTCPNLVLHCKWRAVYYRIFTLLFTNWFHACISYTSI